jgi:hypothetical protein
MAKSLAQRVAATLAKQEKERQAAERAATAPARRSAAARQAAAVRRDNRDDALIEGRVEPRNAREQAIVDSYHFGDL